MTEYTYQLSDAELARYRAMAAHALAREETLWTAAGIVPGARVVDLGCGPGAFLADLAERVGSLGLVAGVDDAEGAVRTAGALVEQLGLAGRVDIVQARIEDTGLARRPPAVSRARCHWLADSGHGTGRAGSGAALDHDDAQAGQ